jgi:hypothetical protein
VNATPPCDTFSVESRDLRSATRAAIRACVGDVNRVWRVSGLGLRVDARRPRITMCLHKIAFRITFPVVLA